VTTRVSGVTDVPELPDEGLSLAVEQATLTLREAAALLRVSRPTLLELAKRSHVPCQRVGRQWRFSRVAVLHWLSGNVRVSRSGRPNERTT